MNISNKVINSPNYKSPLKCIQRNPWADNIRYFLIILVIIGHLGIPLEGRYWYWHYFRNVISVFHMPAFLIITGMYAQKGIKQHDIKKVSKRILVPYIICNFIMFLIFEALGIEKVSGIIQDHYFHVLQPYYALWYLLALFVYYCVCMYINNKKLLVLTAVVLALICGYGYPIKFMWLSKITPFFIYFLLGTLVDVEKIRTLLKKNICRVISIFLFYILFFTCYKYNDVLQTGLFSMEIQYSDYEMLHITPWVIRALVIFCGCIYSLAFFSLVPSNYHFFTKAGQYTIYPFCFQTFCMPIMFYVVSRATIYKIDNIFKCMITCIGCILFVHICSSKYFRKYTNFLIEPFKGA